MRIFCKQHPTYRAIHYPRRLKLSGAVCPSCFDLYLVKAGLRQGMLKAVREPGQPIDLQIGRG